MNVDLGNALAVMTKPPPLPPDGWRILGKDEPPAAGDKVLNIGGTEWKTFFPPQTRFEKVFCRGWNYLDGEALAGAFLWRRKEMRAKAKSFFNLKMKDKIVTGKPCQIWNTVIQMRDESNELWDIIKEKLNNLM